MKIALLYGSKSVEHEISIISALQIYNKLIPKLKVDLIYIDKDLNFYKGEVLKDIKNYSNPNLIKQKAKNITIKKGGKVGKIKYDLFIPLLHGTYGEDGHITGYLEMLGCEYIGNTMKNSIVAHDKYLMKLILEKNNIKTLKYKYISKKDFYNDEDVLKSVKGMKFPLILKAVSLGSSIGVKKVDKENIEYNLQEIFKYDTGIIVEEFQEDFIEVNQAIYESDKVRLSKIEEVIKDETIYSYEDKYNSYDKNTERDFSLSISKEVVDKIEETTKKVYSVFGLTSISRIDYMIIKNEVYVNEINIIPGSLASHLFDEDMVDIITGLGTINKKNVNYIYKDSLDLKCIKTEKLRK